MVCPNCKKMLPNGSAFCSKCGAKLIDVATNIDTIQKGNTDEPVRKKNNGCLIAIIISLIVLCILFFIVVLPDGSNNTNDNTSKNSVSTNASGENIKLYKGYYNMSKEDGTNKDVVAMKVMKGDNDTLACTISYLYSTTDNVEGEVADDVEFKSSITNNGDGTYSIKLDKAGDMIMIPHKDGKEYYAEVIISNDKYKRMEGKYTYKDNGTEEFDYIFEYSDVEKLTYSDLEGHYKEELTMARYEIYARHGYIFKDESISEYFNSKTWYKPTINAEDFDESSLNEIEKYNIEFLKQYEN